MRNSSMFFFLKRKKWRQVCISNPNVLFFIQTRGNRWLVQNAPPFFFIFFCLREIYIFARLPLTPLKKFISPKNFYFFLKNMKPQLKCCASRSDTVSPFSNNSSSWTVISDPKPVTKWQTDILKIPFLFPPPTFFFLFFFFFF